jgi:hypothetical protein
MADLLNDAIWYVIGPAVYQVMGAILALMIMLALLCLALGGSFNPIGWLFGRSSSPFARHMFADDD